MAKSRDVIIEFLPSGAYVKVSAIDVATGTEVSIVGDPHAGEAALEDLAVRKLDYVMGRSRSGQGGDARDRRSQKTPPRKKGLYV